MKRLFPFGPHPGPLPEGEGNALTLTESRIRSKIKIRSIIALAGAAILFARPLASLGQPVEQPPGDAPEQEPPAKAQPAAVETTTPQSRYEQAADPGAAPRTRHQLLLHLFYGVKLELNSVYEGNFDLNDALDDELVETEPRLSFALSYQPHKLFGVFANMRLQREFAPLEGDDLPENERDLELELRDAYVTLREFLPGLSVQVGRQRFRDTREWLFDEQLDAARVVYATDRERVEVSVSREDWWSRDLMRLGADADPDEVFNNYLVHASTRYRDRTIAGYVLVRDGRGATVENDIYYGVHSHGEITDDLEYWLEAAALRGRNGALRNRGVAVDVGLKYDFDTVAWRPSVAIGYARGSGDFSGTDGIDEAFRQTGMQDNSARFNGVTRVRYYGELLNPELSNLTILTAAVGVRPSRRSSIDLVWHYYEQVELNNRRLNTDLRRLRLNGLDLDVGHEIDLVAGYREVKDLDLELTLGYFLPGRANDEPAKDAAFLVRLQARYNW